jgi:2-keto-4-pentenoate hydratase
LPTPAVRQAAGSASVNLTDRPWQQPLLEAEIALRLRAPVTPAQVARLAVQPSWALYSELVDAAAVAIEVVDSRWAERGAAPELLQLADGQWHGALALGDWFPVETLRDLNWAGQACELWRDGERLQAVQGTHPLGDPFWLLPQWLAHLTRDGATVPAGTVVTTGNWIKAPAFEPGAAWEVRFPGLGQVAIQR